MCADLSKLLYKEGINDIGIRSWVVLPTTEMRQKSEAKVVVQRRFIFLAVYVGKICLGFHCILEFSVQKMEFCPHNSLFQ